MSSLSARLTPFGIKIVGLSSGEGRSRNHDERCPLLEAPSRAPTRASTATTTAHAHNGTTSTTTANNHSRASNIHSHGHSSQRVPNEGAYPKEIRIYTYPKNKSSVEIIKMPPPPDPQGVSWALAAFLLVNTALGAGMLNYPYAYKEIGGIGAAALIQLILLVFISSTMFILVYCADFNKDDSYHDVLLSMCGKRAQQISALSILLTCYGINVTFLVIIGDQYDRIFNSLLADPSAWYLDRKFTIFATAVVFILPMCFAHRLDFLRHASVLGMFAMLYVAFLTVYEHYVLDETTISQIMATRASHPELLRNTIKDHTNTTPAASNSTFNPSSVSQSTQSALSLVSLQWFKSLTVVPVLCFAYQTHEVIVPAYSCLKRRLFSDFVKACLLGLAILFLLYNLVGAYGYLTFGDRVGPDIMSLYDAKDPVVVVGIVALVVKFVTTYPPLMFCGRGALDGLYGELRKLSTDELKSSQRQRHLIITTLWFFTTVALAAFAPDISLTLQLLGSMASINVFVLPGLCLVSLTWRLRLARKHSLLLTTSMAQVGIGSWTSLVLYLYAGLLILFGAFIFVVELVDVLGIS